jgi:hypothetical protein
MSFLLEIFGELIVELIGEGFSWAVLVCGRALHEAFLRIGS